MRVPRQQVTGSAKPRQESHCGGSVEPRNMHAASHPTAHASANSAVVPQVKRQVQLEGKMDVDRAPAKPHHAQCETHHEAEEIKITTGHTGPRANSQCSRLDLDAVHQH